MKNRTPILATCTALLLSLSLGMHAFAASGGVIQPPSNTESSLSLKGESGETVAVLNYKTDSDPDKFYIGLSTVWKDSQFEAAFADQDAFFFGFTVNPSISASSLPTLTIINPFADEDGNSVIPTKSIKIYQESNGELTDVTKNFSAGKNDDDYSVFVTKTRKPGMYIFAEQAIDVDSVSPSTDKSSASETKTTKPTIKKKTTSSGSTSSKTSDGVYLPKTVKK